MLDISTEMFDFSTRMFEIKTDCLRFLPVWYFYRIWNFSQYACDMDGIFYDFERNIRNFDKYWRFWRKLKILTDMLEISTRKVRDFDGNVWDFHLNVWRLNDLIIIVKYVFVTLFEVSLGSTRRKWNACVFPSISHKSPPSKMGTTKPEWVITFFKKM